MSRRKEPAIPADLLDQLLAGTDAAAALDQGGLLDTLKKALAERALNAEMDYHLGGDEQAGNSRNGYGRKTVMTDTGKIAIDVPRDRQASFDPQLIAKYQRRFPGFDDQIISMYARGMSTREITGHLREMYGIDVSPDLISTVTDAVLEEVAAWQQRTLDPAYPLVFFDAIRVKIRDEGMVRSKAIHIALGVRADGGKEVLGLWVEQNEGAKFWLRVMNELRNRGTEDIMLAVVDGLKGFPDAITAVFPEAVVQTCIVHLLRNSMDFVSWKDRKPLATALLAAGLGDHCWIAIPGRSGLRMANAWRLKTAMADWAEADFWGSSGFVADEAGFREHVAALAEHQRELLVLPCPAIAPRRSTPWGAAQQSCRYGEGISCHSTAGHGGFHLDDLRNAAVHPLLRHADGWYEEDCDWAKVAFTFPGLFTARARRLAADSLIAYYPDAWEAIHGMVLAPGQSRVKDERRFREAHAADWIVISAVRSDSHPEMVDCIATMGGVRGAVADRHYRVPVGEYSPGAFGFVIDPERHEEVIRAKDA